MALDPKMNAALISASAGIAKEEGLTDEEQIAVRAQAIFEDASKETPETEAGTQAKARANDILAAQATGVASPYATKPKFDYEKFRNETSLPAMEGILKKMGEYSAFLPIPSNCSKEYETASEDAYQKLCMDTFKVLNANNVGMSEFKYVFDSLKAIISALDEMVMQQVIGHRHEIMSRMFGTKNPGTGRYDATYATYEALVDTLGVVREQTGGNMSDYFGKKEEE